MSQDRLVCPVCNAKFRGTVFCSRCGADLSQLIKIVLRSYNVRKSSYNAILSGNYIIAQKQLSEAQFLCCTPRGEQLQKLLSMLLT